MTAMQVPIYRHDGSICAHTLVDANDFAFASKSVWRLNNGSYAVRSARIDGRRHSILLHREILGLTLHDGLEGDHINGDTLDNRRQNLRVTTRRTNGQNVRGWRGASSRYRGVSFFKPTGKWAARAKIDGRDIHLGYFDDEIAAARAASRFRAAHLPYSNETREPLLTGGER